MTLPPAHIQKPVLHASLYDFASFKGGGSRAINTPEWSKYVHVFALREMDPIKSSHCHSFSANPITPKTDISFAGLTVDAVGEISCFLDTSYLINLWEVCIKSHKVFALLSE